MANFDDMNPHPNLENLFSSLIEMLKIQPLDQISITELTAKSGVSRNFYYRNFTKKEDIITSFFEYSTAHFVRTLQHQSAQSNLTILEHYFEHTLELRSIYVILINRGQGVLVSASMWNSLNLLKINGYLPELITDPYWFDFASAGIANVAMNWIISDNPISVHDITVKTMRFLREQIA